jgi:hypothetical protein
MALSLSAVKKQSFPGGVWLGYFASRHLDPALSREDPPLLRSRICGVEDATISQDLRYAVIT